MGHGYIQWDNIRRTLRAEVGWRRRVPKHVSNNSFWEGFHSLFRKLLWILTLREFTLQHRIIQQRQHFRHNWFDQLDLRRAKPRELHFAKVKRFKHPVAVSGKRPSEDKCPRSATLILWCWIARYFSDESRVHNVNWFNYTKVHDIIHHDEDFSPRCKIKCRRVQKWDSWWF